MDTTSSTPAALAPKPGRPLGMTGLVLAVLGVIGTALLLVAPVSVAGGTCGSVMTASDPLGLNGILQCRMARDDRQTLALTVGAVVLAGAALLSLAGWIMNDRARQIALGNL